METAILLVFNLDVSCLKILNTNLPSYQLYQYKNPSLARPLVVDERCCLAEKEFVLLFKYTMARLRRVIGGGSLSKGVRRWCLEIWVIISN